MMQSSENSYTWIKKRKKNPFKRKNLVLLTIGIVCISVFIVAYHKVSDFVRSKGYRNALDFFTTIVSNYTEGAAVKPESISIQIEKKEYKKLEKNRKQALERGVIVNDLDGEFVPAILRYKGKDIKIKLRLKGHMTDHLQEDKWSFRIKVLGDDKFMGMKRFSIQHPGTRGYLTEWVYHELMKREGIIALRYKFIEVAVNGRNWGIYAVEENFENELLENNGKAKNPILRFNPDLYWISRLNELTDVNSYDEYASYYSANPVAYREEEGLQDSTWKYNYLKAITLIESLRNGKISVTDAFDIDKLSKFHAIIDLVGGEHSIDWSDIKYYFDPLKSKLEPIAYESFTRLDSRSISGFYKYVQLDPGKMFSDWHTMLFSDPVFFATYMKQLERMTDRAYLDTFFNASSQEMNQNQAILNKEFPYKKFEKAAYYQRQQMIMRLISPPKALHAYLKKVTSDSITIQAGAIDALPVLVSAISLNNQTITIPVQVILPAKQRGTFVRYTDITIPLPTGWKSEYANSLKLLHNVLGVSEQRKVGVFPFPHTSYDCINKRQSTDGNVSSFKFLKKNEKNKTVLIQPGKNIIDRNLIIPQGYQVIANVGVTLDFIKQAKLISYSSLFFVGSDESPIMILSSDTSSVGIELINAKKSLFKNVVFKNTVGGSKDQNKNHAAVSVFETPVHLNNCNFYNCNTPIALNVIRSDFELKNCLFQQTHTAVNIYYSQGKISNCAFENSMESALNIGMSKLMVNSIFISGSGQSGIQANGGTEVNGNKITIQNVENGILSKAQSFFEINSLTMSNTANGIVAYHENKTEGNPELIISKYVQKHVGNSYLKQSGSTIKIDGIDMTEETSDIKEILQKNAKISH